MKKIILLLILITLAVLPLFSAQEEECSEWNNCQLVYGVENAINTSFSLSGFQERECLVNNEIIKENRECSTQQQIKKKRIKYCNEYYFEIYSIKDELIGRVKEADIQNIKFSDYSKLDIEFSISNKEYCSFCYNGKLDYDEEMITPNGECGGEFCPPCIYEQQNGLLISEKETITIQSIEDINDVLDKWKNNEWSLETVVNIFYNYFS